MPKLKTHHGVKDRIKVTGTGKLMYHKAGRRHLLTGKPSRKTRPLRRGRAIASVDEEKMRRLLPYA